MERFTERITNKETGQVLAYRVPGGKTIQAANKLVMHGKNIQFY